MSRAGEKSDRFQKVLEQVSNPSETPLVEKEKAPLNLTVGAMLSLSASGFYPVDGKEEKKDPLPDAKGEEASPDPVAADPALMAAAGFTIPPATMIQTTAEQNPLPNGPSLPQPPAIAKDLLGMTLPSLGVQPAPKQVNLKAVADTPEMEPQEERSGPIGPTDQKVTEAEAPSKQVSRSDSSGSDRPSSASALIKEEVPPLISGEAHSQKAAAHPGSAPSATPEGASPTGFHSFLKAESVPATGKENNLLSTSSDTGQERSEGAGTEKRSKGSESVPLFANEMTTNLTALSPSTVHANDRIENGVRPSDSVQSKGTPGLAPPEGLPDGRQLLHQIAEKWTLSHGKDEHSFRLRLEPETLGTLQIDISVRQERVVAEVVTKHPYVKAILEGNQELLRGTLADQGLKVDRFSVSLGNPGQASLGWENQLRQRGTDAPFYGSGASLFSAEGGEISADQRWMIQEARGAINIYI
ncbi:MAG: flagellar hook-length control protein FliK [Nitrospirae bacterium]|nr:flagellar hook-length control protein FliK [Candidatus Manganitrophaceae bacterium]